jgi:hypothetical protein
VERSIFSSLSTVKLAFSVYAYIILVVGVDWLSHFHKSRDELPPTFYHYSNHVMCLIYLQQ